MPETTYLRKYSARSHPVLHSNEVSMTADEDAFLFYLDKLFGLFRSSRLQNMRTVQMWCLFWFTLWISLHPPPQYWDSFLEPVKTCSLTAACQLAPDACQQTNELQYYFRDTEMLKLDKELVHSTALSSIPCSKVCLYSRVIHTTNRVNNRADDTVLLPGPAETNSLTVTRLP